MSEERVDISMLTSLVGDNRMMHCKLFESFTKSTPQIIEDIKQAHERHDVDAVRQHAHKMKSSSRSMGASQLADLCEGLEKAGKESQWDQINSLVSQLDDNYSAVASWIETYCSA
ncbi:Hpt domain-containing protein [Solemya velum gill symbiont]|uniref:HPt domain-containing protein n=1 Tax=Solemya velum gill symbiont TaxID=2340 RepID=A0A0B0H8H8_SOVGS|nr:Hpt domain-containing protein [Solemya velum gill symbiont]KHF24952.1 HPt domain-containing protein [Solemya velum gill symbiont]OOY34613.1 hypothetical protein BOV88_09170 [Solemya velum gill symbiont]OOY37405.1 hypothetical protein BOV89_07600 [Solemya velum gill symbiont]OOY39955.1 hypothetical protein BOV90_06660 [Solemya velum gill symbiont]OOY44364.1 hypothetical protein BOV91_01570 [Solemya velum gill symbiont]